MSEASHSVKEAASSLPLPEQLTAARLGRWYALSGAVWFVLAALFLVLGLLQLGLGIDVRLAPLGVGRLHVAYRFVALFGAISLPPAGLLVVETLRHMGDGLEAPLARAKRGLQLWNAGLLVGCVAIFAGMLRAEPSAGAPAFAEILIWLGALLWLSVLSSRLLPRPGIRAGEAYGLLAGVGFLILLLLGMLLSANLRGHGQALASTIYLRGLVDLWAIPLGLSTAALLLPRILRAPHHGRRALLVGLLAWPTLAVLGLSRDLAPDILAGWLIRPADAFSSLAMVAVASIGIGLFGSFVGRPQSSSADRDDILLVAAGLVFLLGGMWMEAWRLPAARRLFMLGPWSVGGIFPAWAGLFLLSTAAGRALIEERVSEGLNIRRASLFTTLLGLSLLVFPLMAAGVAEAAIGGSAELLALQSRFRLPGAFVLLLGVVAWLVEARSSHDAPDASGSLEVAGPEAQSAPDAALPLDAANYPGASVVMASTAAILAAGIIVSILIPLADPALDEPGLRAEARRVTSGSLSADGQQIYTREACAACHSQRVRAFEAGASLGPATVAGDVAGAPSHTGVRRAGPDLSWTGDHPSLIEGVSTVHGPSGMAPMSWLFETGGPTPEGEALITYLEGLTARSSSGDLADSDAEEGP